MTRVMKFLSWPLREIYTFWTKPVRAESLALFRTLLGICLLMNLWITIIPCTETLAGEDGICAIDALDPYLQRQGMICLIRGPQGIPFHQILPIPRRWLEAWADWGSTPYAVNCLFILFSLSTVCMTIGLFTRSAIVATWLLDLTIYQRFVWVMNGGDDVARMALFYLLFARSGAVWSVDSWLWRSSGTRNDGSSFIPAWPLRLMQIQFSLIYFYSALAKLAYKFMTPDWLLNDWVNGEALYWLYNDLEIVRWPYHWTPIPLWFCRLQTWAVISFEICFPFLVLFSWTRLWTLAFGVLMHLGIWLHTEIAFFSPFMICWYVLFIPGNHWSWWLMRQDSMPTPDTLLAVPPRQNNLAHFMSTCNQLLANNQLAKSQHLGLNWIGLLEGNDLLHEL